MKPLVIEVKITQQNTDSFVQYLKEVNKIKTFTKEEEEACTKLAFDGDKDAINELVRRNLRFVISVAKQYTTSKTTLEDLVNEGNIGLIMAANKFNPEKGYKFISFAVYWIRKIILEYITVNGRLVRLPANKVDSLSKFNKQVIEMEQRLGREVSIEELLEEFGSDWGGQPNSKFVNSDTDYTLLSMLNNYNVDSTDKNIGDDSDVTLGDTMSDTSIFKPTDFNIELEDLKSDILSSMSGLSDRDKNIMVGLFGLDGKPERTIKEMGEIYGLTRERVRQIKETSILTMKKTMPKRVLYK